MTHAAQSGIDGLTAAIKERAREHALVLVALDGRCASGKTTLARALGERFGWSVVHMDDFFLQPSQRTAARYASPGENVDHERFLAQVLLPLREGKTARYRPFDCQTQDFAREEKTVAPAGVVLVEGAYACHSALWDFYDLRAFLTVDREEQLRRIKRRNGPERLAVFRDKWIPLEEKYFAAFDIERRCDCRIDNTAAG